MFYILAAPAFGAKHLLGLLYVVILVVIGILLLGKKSSKREILIITVIFYILEIMKIGFLVIRSGSYPMNHLPFHLCSMPLYIWVVLYFSKENSKLEAYALATAFVTVLGGGIAAMVLPANIIGNELTWFPLIGNYLPIVSFTYHGIMLMSALYLITSGKYKPRFTDAFRAMTFSFGLMILAMLANLLLDKDYMLLNYGTGSPFKFILDNNGQTAYTLTMIVAGLFVIGTISVISTGLHKLIERIKG